MKVNNSTRVPINSLKPKNRYYDHDNKVKKIKKSLTKKFNSKSYDHIETLTLSKKKDIVERARRASYVGIYLRKDKINKANSNTNSNGGIESLTQTKDHDFMDDTKKNILSFMHSTGLIESTPSSKNQKLLNPSSISKSLQLALVPPMNNTNTNINSNINNRKRRYSIGSHTNEIYKVKENYKFTSNQQSSPANKSKDEIDINDSKISREDKDKKELKFSSNNNVKFIEDIKKKEDKIKDSINDKEEKEIKNINVGKESIEFEEKVEKDERDVKDIEIVKEKNGNDNGKEIKEIRVAQDPKNEEDINNVRILEKVKNHEDTEGIEIPENDEIEAIKINEDIKDFEDTEDMEDSEITENIDSIDNFDNIENVENTEIIQLSEISNKPGFELTTTDHHLSLPMTSEKLSPSVDCHHKPSAPSLHEMILNETLDHQNYLLKKNLSNTYLSKSEINSNNNNDSNDITTTITTTTNASNNNNINNNNKISNVTEDYQHTQLPSSIAIPNLDSKSTPAIVLSSSSPKLSTPLSRPPPPLPSSDDMDSQEDPFSYHQIILTPPQDPFKPPFTTIATTTMTTPMMNSSSNSSSRNNSFCELPQPSSLSFYTQSTQSSLDSIPPKIKDYSSNDNSLVTVTPSIDLISRRRDSLDFYFDKLSQPPKRTIPFFSETISYPSTNEDSLTESILSSDFDYNLSSTSFSSEIIPQRMLSEPLPSIYSVGHSNFQQVIKENMTLRNTLEDKIEETKFQMMIAITQLNLINQQLEILNC